MIQSVVDHTISGIVSTFLPSSKLLRSSTSSRKTQIKCLFIRILPSEKCKQTAICSPSLNTDTALGGPYEPEALRQYRNGQKSTILFRHSIQTHVSGGFSLVLMIPACCVQQDRFPTCEHGMTSRLLDCNHLWT